VELVEPAKPTALEKLGEAEPALEVAVGWPRPKRERSPRPSAGIRITMIGWWRANAYNGQ